MNVALKINQSNNLEIFLYEFFGKRFIRLNYDNEKSTYIIDFKLTDGKTGHIYPIFDFDDAILHYLVVHDGNLITKLSPAEFEIVKPYARYMDPDRHIRRMIKIKRQLSKRNRFYKIVNKIIIRAQIFNVIMPIKRLDFQDNIGNRIRFQYSYN